MILFIKKLLLKKTKTLYLLLTDAIKQFLTLRKQTKYSSKQAANSHGYILVLALMITSVTVAMVSSLFYRSLLHYQRARYTYNKEQARILARSGIECALGQLNGIFKRPPQQKKQAPGQEQKKPEPKEQPNKQDSGKKELSPRKQRTDKLLKLLNRWQTFELKDSKEGIDATIKLYVACESGKININKMYDFSKKQFVKQGEFEASALLQLIFGNITQFTQKKDLFPKLSKFLKKQKFNLPDATSLFTDKDLRILGNNYAPDIEAQKKQLYFSDLFTIDSDSLVIDPLFLSSSLAIAVGFKTNKIKNTQEFLSKVPDKIDWSRDWDTILQPIYGKKYENIPEPLKNAIGSQFEPNVFSVVSYARVGEITQKMYAILHKDRKTNRFIIKKFYWL